MRSINIKFTLSTLLFALIGSWSVTAAPNSDFEKLEVEECQMLIDDLATTVSMVEISDRDRAGLERKLASATMKLNQGKVEDAILKLMDFKAKVESMFNAAKPKISESDAALLIEGAGSVISCLSA